MWDSSVFTTRARAVTTIPLLNGLNINRAMSSSNSEMYSLLLLALAKESLENGIPISFRGHLCSSENCEIAPPLVKAAFHKKGRDLLS